MKPRHLFALLLPLGLTACAVTTADLVGENHPANPAAAPAPAKERSSTLQATDPFASPPPASMPASVSPAETHDPSAHESMTGDEASMDNVLYTCPMHPDVVQDAPGTCPECGMELRPVAKESPEMGGQHESP